ncbi:MAG: ribonuclease HI [Planctomycetes bacterium]|nr:ribonuclease HI [Planctomycetota bacterium]NOG55620.1 ribonuclease HI [Planctomycetota bacterium]
MTQRKKTARKAASPKPAKDTESTLDVVQLFTDGACSGNPGPGGWAFILKHPPSGTVREHSGGEANTTNNRMELMAVIQGLTSIKKRCVVELYADSQYVLKGLEEWMDNWKTHNWRRGKRGPKVKNIELWQQLDELRTQHELRFNWVRGHAGHPENERCDELAVQASEQYK